ncbi:cyclic peptide export ABC transporter [Chondromyces apiculatus]|uniref:Putative ABC transporter ATP-binding protein n=1 Tax=Chondromyces apiculatus DSM 436 TaxID=1192034 RepID=A0A017T724_9BACT|nr:cyclic peptide export ABC transporter [Chondromyces apiculatus]EYF04580.1 putative ABC transporter ATP-binding protein [Chondromyces apiculatus DSM 436]
MTLIDLISGEAEDKRFRILAAASLAGAANTATVALVNAIAQRKSGGATLGDCFLFLALIAVYVVGSRYTCHGVSATLEDALHHIKVRNLEKIERASYEAIERIGTAEIYDRISANVSRISSSAALIANLLQSLFMSVAAGLYIATLSLPAFALLVLLFGAGIALFYQKARDIAQNLQAASAIRMGFFEQLTDLFQGFKEVKLNQRRGRELREDIQGTSGSLRGVTTTSNNALHDHWLFAQCNLYVGLAALIFVLPQHVEVEASVERLLIGGVLLVWGPVVTCLAGFPVYLESNVSLANIEALERKLDAAASEDEAPIDPWKGRLTRGIEVKDLAYTYAAAGAQESFHIGPLSLDIAAGEIVFIVGGNGSGKSTFLKVLTGLYPPSEGTLRADRFAVTPDKAPAYRELISAIYSDFHIFSKLYGLLGVPESSVSPLLKRMQIEDKTSFAADRFTRVDLSTGQRKRLAMIVTLLEDRPLCVFDEWAADQDPEFRKYFYEELLPSLKQQGKTVIAVSHDDRYFHCADRVVTMEYGQIRSIESPHHPGAAIPGAPSADPRPA